jgi:hypothetical protein
MPFTLVFMNCYNLYEPGAHPRRGPQNQIAFDRKVRALSETAITANGNQPPDLLALAEVGSEAAGTAVADAIDPGIYSALWSGVPAGSPRGGGSETGLMLLYKDRVLVPTGNERRDLPNHGGRHKWFAVEFQVQPGITGSFWLVVNHWTSNFRRDPAKADDLRVASAQELGTFFATLAGAAEAAMLVGDFNCEPCAKPFVGENNTDRLFAVRERALVLRDRNRLFYVYNPMWRYLGEADAYEDTLIPAYLRQRPPGTYATDRRNHMNWRMWDQLLVSKRMLNGGPVQLQERTLRVQFPAPNASDHCAIAATFQ